MERDFALPGFRFGDGSTLPDLRLHVKTIGEPNGARDNAVLLLHGTGGHGGSLLRDVFTDHLFGPGQPLDASRYFLILPDAVGHGWSSKPSDGLRARFPRYRYGDLIRAQRLLVFGHLGVSRLRLVMGTSMGGMHTWMWGESHPDAMDALMPLACAPVEIAGRNRIVRKMAIDAIRNDPAWRGGDYEAQPPGLVGALNAVMLMGSSPLQMLREAPTREAADRLYKTALHERLATADANDLLYALEASEDYDPSPHLERIVAPLTAVNSADDFVNPPELGVLEREIGRVPKGEFVLLPITDATRGHGTHTLAEVWREHLVRLLARSERGA